MTGAPVHPLLRLLRASATGEGPVVLTPDEVDPVALGAARHGLSAWLDGSLPTLAPQAPAQLVQRLRGAAQATVAQNLRNKRMLKRALVALSEVGVTPVLLKGLGFGRRYYDNPLVRPSSDVDLLVAPSQLEKSARALGGLGLKQLADPGALEGGLDSRHLCFGGSEGLVELHFRALHGFGAKTLELEDLEARCVRGDWEGHSIRYLGPDDELVYMAAHAANHLFARLSWALDLELHRRAHPTPDWARVEHVIARGGLANAMTVAWRVGQRVFGWAPLPREAEGWAADARRGRAIARILNDAQLLSGAISAHRVGSFLLRAGMSDSFGGAVAHVSLGAGRYARRLVARTG